MARTDIGTERIPYYNSTLTRLAAPLATPDETYRAAEALARTVFPREPGTDAIRRLHGLSHTMALLIAEHADPYIEHPEIIGLRDPLEGDE